MVPTTGRKETVWKLCDSQYKETMYDVQKRLCLCEYMTLCLLPAVLSSTLVRHRACSWLVWQGKTQIQGGMTGGKTQIWKSFWRHQLWPVGESWPGRANCPRRPDVTGRRWPDSGEEEPSGSYADPGGPVHERPLNRAYRDRMLNHRVLYTTGHSVPPAYPVAILRLFLLWKLWKCLFSVK